MTVNNSELLKRQKIIFDEQKQATAELIEKGDKAYILSDFPSALDSLYDALSACNMINIVYPDTYQLEKLQTKIDSIEKKLGLNIVHEGDKYGFADKDGVIVIPCIWNDVKGFSDGLCRVEDENHLYGFINYSGELIIPCDYRDAESFDDGMAWVEGNIDDVFPVTGFIDREGGWIASAFELKYFQIKAVYNSTLFAFFVKYQEAAECILPACNTLDENPMILLLKYLLYGHMYDKLIERCKKILKFDERTELVVNAKFLLGICYENGFGVGKDLIEAFRYYNSMRYESGISNEDYHVLDDFVERHPELKELSEVQDALNPVFDDEDF